MSAKNIIALVAGIVSLIVLALGMVLNRADPVTQGEKLAPGAPVVTISGDKVTVASAGKTTTKYLPPEGKVTVNLAKIVALSETIDSVRGVLAETRAGPDSVKDINAALSQSRALLDSMSRILSSPIERDLITITTRGLCLKPLAGVGWNGEWDGFAGAKLAYWGPWGLVAGTTRRQIGAGISRRLPYLSGIEGVVVYGYPYKTKEKNFWGGVAIHLR